MGSPSGFDTVRTIGTLLALLAGASLFDIGGQIMAINSATTMNPAKAREFFEAEMAFTTGPVELDRRRKSDPNIVIVDVREPEDFREGHVPGAVNLPKAQWQTVKGLSKDKVNIIYCYSHVCHLAKQAALEFASKGYPVMEMEGGFKAWREHEMEIER
jgi:rhodanese-related sulfurtransferase